MVMPAIPNPIPPVPEPYMPEIYPPTHSEAPLVIFFAFYTPSGQQKNLTIRADSVPELAARHQEVIEWAEQNGWADVPPMVAYASSLATKSEPVYVQDDNAGPQKYRVISVEEKFITKPGKNQGKPYLRVTVAHPSIDKPLMAWFETWKDKSVATILRPDTVTPASMLPEDMQHAYVDRGMGKNGMEWKLVSFAK